MEVRHEQIALDAYSHPVARSASLTIRAIPVLATFAGHAKVSADGVACLMHTKRFGPVSERTHSSYRCPHSQMPRMVIRLRHWPQVRMPKYGYVLEPILSLAVRFSVFIFYAEV